MTSEQVEQILPKVLSDVEIGFRMAFEDHRKNVSHRTDYADFMYTRGVISLAVSFGYKIGQHEIEFLD